MSFFDEADEPPPTEIRTPSRPAPRRRQAGSRVGGGGGSGGSGSGSGSGGSGRGGSGSRSRRPPAANRQSVRTRQAVALGAIVVVIVLIAVGVNSCQSSSRKSALRDYANGVNSVVADSDQTGSALFKVLTSGASSTNATSIQNSINATGQRARDQLQTARGFSAPSSATTANANLIRALQMRADGITNIANEIQPALGTSVNRQAVTQIAGQMARFYASDVLYKDYTAPLLASALHANGIAVGGGGVTINGGQFLPSIQWLDPSTVASTLNVDLGGNGGSSSNGKATPGLHGHTLNSVSVNGTTLQPGATNTVASKPAPTFQLAFANGGNHDETDVTCKVTVTGTSASGTKIVPRTVAGSNATCDVTLSTVPPTGTYNVVATVEKVPGEKNVKNNTLTFPVTFN